MTDIAQRYRVEAMLGQGGMGTVYRVVDGVTGRRMALKRLDTFPAEGAGGAEQRQHARPCDRADELQ
jgi:eukaryotic-like serine/threonine-protein kinase